MEDYNYKPNSIKSKTETQKLPEKKVEKVVTGPVKTKKKSEARKIIDIFISEDARNVKDYIFMDVLVPAIKKAIVDIATDGINMIFYGTSGSRARRSNADRFSYNQISSDRFAGRTQDRRSRSYSYDEITITNRGEAEEVLDRLAELIQTYGMASVADLNDLIGITGEYTDNKYGWTNVRTARAVRVPDGYMLDLPRPMPID